jgi:hypothetical protein
MNGEGNESFWRSGGVDGPGESASEGSSRFEIVEAGAKGGWSSMSGESLKIAAIETSIQHLHSL